MKKYLLEIIVFTSGACVMILELVGSRILAPFIGASIVTWTSLIGIILASLSFGYYQGGKWADKSPETAKLSSVIFLSAIAVIIIVGIRLPIMYLFEFLKLNIVIRSILATLIFFTLPSVLMGMVSPFAAKLKLESVKKTGGVIGNLYAISTSGSIVGTFLTGFYLLSNFSTVQILFGISLVLFLSSIILIGKFNSEIITRVIIYIFLVMGCFLIDQQFKPTHVLALDTQYNSVLVYEAPYIKNGRTIRVMSLDSKFDSAMYLDSNELVFDYSKFYHLAEEFNPKLKSILVIGGAGYSTPKDYLERFPELSVDVVEIDPALTQLARKYFNLKNDSRLTIYHEDGRTFLNRMAQKNGKKYDAIMIDAFKGYSIPFQLTTQESMQLVSSMLQENGVLLANVIASIEGDSGKFLRAEYNTLKTVFPLVYVFPVTNPSQGKEVQNIMVVASKSPQFIEHQSVYLDNLWKKPISQDLPILTDDFAPVDQYMLNALY